MGICDRQCRLCFSLCLWNEQDPILKERVFGLTGPEGNHGEDCKECYYYLDSTPTHSYMKALYKYPQAAYPYSQLLEENRRRGVTEPEFELEDSGVFNEGKYWDVFAEYAKAGPSDILVKITVANRGPQMARLHLLPTLWYRNTWVWGCKHEGCTKKPLLKEVGEGHVRGKHETLDVSHFYAGRGPDGQRPRLLWTENETNSKALFDLDNYTPYTKDAFHRFVRSLSLSLFSTFFSLHSIRPSLFLFSRALLASLPPSLSSLPPSLSLFPPSLPLSLPLPLSSLPSLPLSLPPIPPSSIHHSLTLSVQLYHPERRVSHLSQLTRNKGGSLLHPGGRGWRDTECVSEDHR